MNDLNVLYVLLSSIIVVTTQAEKNNKLVLILLDGVRWDYLDQDGIDLPGLRRIIREGVTTDYMVPDMPTLSYPNYYSLMTGLHVESHGFAGNYMYDFEHDTYFNKGLNPEQIHSYWWDNAEPLWISAVKQGKRAYMYYWPGCEVEIRGYKATFCQVLKRVPTIKQLQHSVDDSVQVIMEDKADLIGIYVELIDDYGHKYGPKSPEMNDILTKVDREINRLIEALEREHILDSVNIMIFSDHGMTPISDSRIIDISPHVDMEDVDIMLEQGPNCYIWPKDGKLEKVYTGLASMENPHVTTYLKSDIPDLWFYKSHPRISPILLVAENGWVIITPKKSEFLSYSETGPMKGYHGYAKEEEDMRAFFAAAGPDFKRNYRIKPFLNIQLYQIMCKVLNMTSQPHNGTWSEVKDMLIGEHSSSGVDSLLLFLLVSCLFLFLVLKLYKKYEAYGFKDKKQY